MRFSAACWHPWYRAPVAHAYRSEGGTGDGTRYADEDGTGDGNLQADAYRQGLTRKDIIEKFIAEVKLTKAGASTYYQMIKDKHEPVGKK